jgi:hypothetical protein
VMAETIRRRRRDPSLEINNSWKHFHLESWAQSRVARFFWYNIPKRGKYAYVYQIAEKYTKMAVK